ncbi:MAG TPA: carbohydrate-binding family 9-like protein, partial [Anaerolineales bacterium]|nr:carbohydrate-binding family 9-like protein [Anaerolineales bacterium]
MTGAALLHDKDMPDRDLALCVSRADVRDVDLIGGHPTKYATDVAVGWDDSALYLGYRIEEPNVAGSFTERDSPIWQENDVEFFIAGDDAYY